MYLIKLILHLLCSIRDRILFGKTTVGLEAPIADLCISCEKVSGPKPVLGKFWCEDCQTLEREMENAAHEARLAEWEQECTEKGVCSLCEKKEIKSTNICVDCKDYIDWGELL